MNWKDVKLHPLPKDRSVLVTCHNPMNDYRWVSIHSFGSGSIWQRDVVAWTELPKPAKRSISGEWS